MSISGVIGVFIVHAYPEAAFHSTQTSAQLNTDEKLSDLQLSQGLSTFPKTFEDPDACYQHHLFFRKRRATGIGTSVSTNDFWLSPTLKRCASSKESAMVILKGTLNTRYTMQDFGVDIIQSSSAYGATTFWALPGAGIPKPGSAVATEWTTSNLIRCLTYQALRTSGVVGTENQMRIRYSQFQTARTPKEWLEVFKHVVFTLRGPIYLIVDLAMIRPTAEEAEGFNFIQELSQVLSQFAAGVNVKVVLLLYEMDWFRLLPRELSSYVVNVRMARQKRQQSRAMAKSVKTGRSFSVARGRRL